MPGTSEAVVLAVVVLDVAGGVARIAVVVIVCPCCLSASPFEKASESDFVCSTSVRIALGHWRCLVNQPSASKRDTHID